MELRHARYFLAVAEELHFGRAARKLRIAQSPLSRQIQDLERELGTALFVRDRRSVALTAAGEAFRARALRLVANVEEAIEAARSAGRGELGRLRVGYVPSATATRLPDLLRAFHRRFPRVDLSVHELTPTDQIEALLAERLDVGFARGPLHEPELAREVFCEEPLSVALPAGHALAQRRSLRMAALAGEPFLLPARARGSGMHDQILGLCRGAGFSPNVVGEGTQHDVQLLVAAGAGIALVPASHRGLRHAGVVLRPLLERPTTALLLAWREAPSPVVNAFIAEARRLRGAGSSSD